MSATGQLKLDSFIDAPSPEPTSDQPGVEDEFAGLADHELPDPLTRTQDRVGKVMVTRDELLANEAWCLECSKKVTYSPDSGKQYGHKRSCPHVVKWSRRGDGE